MATKRTKSIADSLLPKPEPKRELDLGALERQVQAIHEQAEAKKAEALPHPIATVSSAPKKASRRSRNADQPPEKMYRLSIDLPESVYFQMREKIGQQRMKVTHRALVMGLIEEFLSKTE